MQVFLETQGDLDASLRWRGLLPPSASLVEGTTRFSMQLLGRESSVPDPVAAAQPAARRKDLMRAMREAAAGMRGGVGREVPLQELDLRRLREAAEEMREQLSATSRAVRGLAVLCCVVCVVQAGFFFARRPRCHCIPLGAVHAALVMSSDLPKRSIPHTHTPPALNNARRRRSLCRGWTHWPARRVTWVWHCSRWQRWRRLRAVHLPATQAHCARAAGSLGTRSVLQLPLCVQAKSAAVSQAVWRWSWGHCTTRSRRCRCGSAPQGPLPVLVCSQHAVHIHVMYVHCLLRVHPCAHACPRARHVPTPACSFSPAVQAAIRGYMSREHQMLTWHTLEGDLEAKQKALADADRTKVRTPARALSCPPNTICFLLPLPDCLLQR